MLFSWAFFTFSCMSPYLFGGNYIIYFCIYRLQDREGIYWGVLHLKKSSYNIDEKICAGMEVFADAVE